MKIVEDEADLVSGFLAHAQKEKYHADIAMSYSEAAEKLSLHGYDCIMLDINQPDGKGLQLLRQLKSNRKDNVVIIISARNSLDDKITLLNLGANAGKAGLGFAHC